MSTVKNAIKGLVSSAFVACAAIAVPSAALAEPPLLSTSWEFHPNASHATCVNRAVRAMERAGLANVERVGDLVNNPNQARDTSVFGTYGDYSASVRCITNQGIAVFIAAGPVGRRSSELRNEIATYFLNP